MPPIITDQDAAEAGVPKELFQQWADIMQVMWSTAIEQFRIRKEDERWLPKNGENEIIIGDRFFIKVNFVNNSYLQVCLLDKEIELAEIRYTSKINPVVQAIFIMLLHNNS